LFILNQKLKQQMDRAWVSVNSANSASGVQSNECRSARRCLLCGWAGVSASASPSCKPVNRFHSFVFLGPGVGFSLSITLASKHEKPSTLPVALTDTSKADRGAGNDYSPCVKLSLKGKSADDYVHTGLCLLEGRGVPVDHVEAARCFKLAADQDHPDGQFSYGSCLYDGRGVPMDYHLGAQYWKLAADQNHPDGQFSYGRWLVEGFAGRTDVVEAAKYFKLAADQNHDAAQFFYGLCLSEGRGVPIDYATAAQYFKRAADQNHPSAQVWYGICLLDGRVVSTHSAKAANSFRLSAAQNRPLISGLLLTKMMLMGNSCTVSAYLKAEVCQLTTCELRDISNFLPINNMAMPLVDIAK
jgi:hypothetical protein